MIGMLIVPRWTGLIDKMNNYINKTKIKIKKLKN